MKHPLFIVLDGNALLHRAWHSIPPLTTSDGTVVNAVYGFTNIIEKILTDYKPDSMVVAWDLPGKTFRHEAYADYKGTRKKKEPELYDQIPIIKEVLSGYDIPSLSKEGFEADDILGTIAKDFGGKDGLHVLIVTGDLDALQLVTDDVSVLAFIKGLSQTKTYDPRAVMERYALRTDQLVDLKALMGDSSDNIPGFAGVGQKTATSLLQEHETIEGIYAAIKDGLVPSKFAKKFDGKEDFAEEMRHLVTIVDDVDLGIFKPQDAKVVMPDAGKLTQLFRELEFKTLEIKYKEQMVEHVEEVTKQEQKTGKVESDIVFVVWNEEEVIISDGKKKEHIARKSASKRLHSKKMIIGHDLKSLMHRLDSAITAPLFDTMVIGYVLNSALRDFSLASLSREYLQRELEEGIDAQLYAIREIAEIFEDKISQEKAEKIVYEIEMPLISILFQMEKEGIVVDKKHLSVLSSKLEGRIHELTKHIHKLAGREFNIKSPSQLAVILFDDLNLPTKKIKKTKTGYSTAASELEKLRGTHDIIPLISEYRELTKLKSTYIDTLPDLIDEDGRVHTSYNQTVAATGRLSSSDPNLQNIPIRTALGNEIRKAFIAPPGKTLLAADYSQFELRLAAYISKDKELMDAFNSSTDVHTRTAARILNKEMDEVSKSDRRLAKAVNFGILYGMGSRSLARSVGIRATEAKSFIERYFEIHPGLKSYMEEMKLRAHKNEYVETLFGRRRYLKDINSGIQMLVAAAERMAINMPIQGTQADLVKMAMIQVRDWIDSSEFDVKMLLQVHDELVFEIANKDLEQVVPEIKRIMEDIWQNTVPLIVDAEIGSNWGELKDWE